MPAFAPTDDDIARLLANGEPHPFAFARTPSGTRTRCGSPTARRARHHREATARPALRGVRRADWEAGLDQWDPDDWAARVRRDRRPLRRARHQAPRRVLPVADRGPQPAPVGLAHRARRRRRARRRGARRGDALRPLLLRRARLDLRDRARSAPFADLLAAMPRGDYPAYAEAQVRELIDRYRPCVLWNDIAWPTTAAPARGRSSTHYYERCPTAWSTTAGHAVEPATGRAQDQARSQRVVDRAAAQATRGGGLVPPKPPVFDVRTPEYAVVRRHRSARRGSACGAWTRSFGYNRTSRREPTS